MSIEAELEALKESEKEKNKKKAEEKPKYVINATEDEIYLMASCVMMEAGGYSYDLSLIHI